jgi:hypothetical protein
MKQHLDLSTAQRVGVIATRLAGTDGVSLETEKWLQVMEEVGIEPYYFAGELDRPDDRSYLVPEAHFSHPSIQMLNDVCFGRTNRTSDTTKTLHQIKDVIELDGYVTDSAVQLTREVLNNDQRRLEMVDLNYSLGEEHFSYDTLRRELRASLLRNRRMSGIEN